MECVGRSLADVDNNGRLSVDEFCVAMHLVEMTKLGQTLPAVLPLDLVPPAYRTTAHSPLLTTATMNAPQTSAPHVITPGLVFDKNISAVELFVLKALWILFPQFYCNNGNNITRLVGS